MLVLGCEAGAVLISSAHIEALRLAKSEPRSDALFRQDGGSFWGKAIQNARGERMGRAAFGFEQMANPIDLIEQIAHRNDWGHDRTSDDELTLIVGGTWTDYHVSINWRSDIEALHIACAFDFKIPEQKVTEVYRLIGQINEQLWIGHFDLWTREGLIMFRHGLPLQGTIATVAQCEALLKAALEACEKYYQAFQFVVWAGKPSREALVSTMFETEGQA